MQLSYEYLAVLAVVGASLCHVTYEWSKKATRHVLWTAVTIEGTSLTSSIPAAGEFKVH